MKKKILNFIDTYLIWVLAAGGILVAFYGAWFQTEGFTLAATPLMMILEVMAIGGIIGAAIMSYLVSITKKKVVGKKKLIRSELAPMLRGYMLCFVLCVFLVYTAKTIASFYFGLGGIIFTSVTAWYYLIWGFIEKKKKEKEAESQTASDRV